MTTPDHDTQGPAAPAELADEELTAPQDTPRGLSAAETIIITVTSTLATMRHDNVPESDPRWWLLRQLEGPVNALPVDQPAPAAHVAHEAGDSAHDVQLRRPRTWADDLLFGPSRLPGNAGAAVLALEAEERRLEDIIRGADPTPTAAKAFPDDYGWDDLVTLLDAHWPTDIFPVGPDSDDRDMGPRILSLARHLTAQATTIQAVKDALAGYPVCDQHTEDDPIVCGWKRAVADARAALEGTRS